ncbi:hypothetical protein T484DRAFT_1777686 [Baffinella frigidus]|nr:hypothetical protein T484DRAFT_1777686 [Cryptophyta sp. CCMP2293]
MRGASLLFTMYSAYYGGTWFVATTFLTAIAQLAGTMSTQNLIVSAVSVSLMVVFVVPRMLGLILSAIIFRAMKDYTISVGAANLFRLTNVRITDKDGRTVEINEVALIPRFMTLQSTTVRTKWLALMIRGAKIRARSHLKKEREGGIRGMGGDSDAGETERKEMEARGEEPHQEGAGASILQEGMRAVAKSLLPVGVQFAGWLASSGIELVVLDTGARVRVDELGHACAVAQEEVEVWLEERDEMEPASRSGTQVSPLAQLRDRNAAQGEAGRGPARRAWRSQAALVGGGESPVPREDEALSRSTGGGGEDLVRTVSEEGPGLLPQVARGSEEQGVKIAPSSATLRLRMVLFPWEVRVASLAVRIGEVEVDLDDELLLKVAQLASGPNEQEHPQGFFEPETPYDTTPAALTLNP